jgi:ABC-type transport system involved in multi-copper enzyme maturation permease subunit
VRTVSAVAVSVLRESVRDRVPYNLVVFAVLLIGSSFLLGQLTAGQDVKIVKDLGLAATLVFGLFIAVFIGIGLVSKEVERRSIYALLAKPITRPQFIAGKYAGLVLTLAVNLAVMAAALYIVLAGLLASQPPALRAAGEAPGLDSALLVAILLIFCELCVVTAIALFFSTFSTPLVSSALTLALWGIGHFNTELKNFDQVVNSRPVAWLAGVIYHVLPDFSAFDIKAQVVHGIPIAPGYVLTTIGYGVAYAAGLVLVSTLIFARRDLK